MNGKKILVTGASGVLGRALCEKYASLGADVIIHYYSNSKKAFELRDQLCKKYSRDYLVVYGDIRIESDVIDIFTKVGNIDVLINNAAYYYDDDFYTKDISYVKDVIDTNVIGAYNMCKNIKVNDVIINISSNCSLGCGYSESIDYNMSKSAINCLSLDLADLLAPCRVLSLALGWFETNVTFDESFKNNEIDKILLGRFARVEEIVDSVVFFSGASYINKTIIRIDGGIK